MTDIIKDYINKHIQLIRLTFAEKMANSSASLIVTIIFIAIFSLTFLFLSLGLGFYIGEKYDSYSIGFFSVGVIYLILLVLIIIFKQPLIHNPIRNKVLLNFLNSKNKNNSKK